MIDSGAAGNFIDVSFAKSHNIPLIPCESRVAVAALDGRPLGSGRIKYITPEIQLQTGALHTEFIRLFAIESPQNPVILGLPWLERHNPRISWSTQEILQWSKSCQRHCLCQANPPFIHRRGTQALRFSECPQNTKIYLKPSAKPKRPNFLLIDPATVPSTSSQALLPLEAGFSPFTARI